MRHLLAVVVLTLDLWAIVSVLGSRERGAVKLLWVAIIVVVPLAGFFAWLLFGPKR